MASTRSALDDLDDATAQLIIKLQLQDLQDLAPSQQPPDPTHSEHDDDVARRVFEDELKLYGAIRALDTSIETANSVEDQENPYEDVPEPVRIPHFQCTSCGSHNPVDRDFLAACDHHYCDGCLEELFRLSMTDEALYPPRCCSTPIPFEEVRLFLSAELQHDFHNKMEELDDRNRAYCHVPTCSTYISAQDREGDVALCPQCHESTCTVCNSAAHIGRDCPQDVAAQSLLTLAQSQGWQRCRQCARMVELTIGCNHITCICRHQFCYRCGERWKTCDCPQFDEHRLYRRAQVVADRVGGDAAAIADRLRDNHACNHDIMDWVHGAHVCDDCGHNMPNFIYRCYGCHLQRCRRCRFNLD